MTHTRAPWKAGNDNGFWGQDCCIEANDPEVGTVVVCDFIHSSAIEEEANKALIMAAPYLLSDCEQVIAWLMIDPNFQDWPAAQSYLRQLQSNVARARGGEMKRYRFYCIREGRKWYYTSRDYVTLQGHAQPGIFTEADWNEWGNNGRNEREEIAEDEAMPALSVVEGRLAGAPRLPGIDA